MNEGIVAAIVIAMMAAAVILARMKALEDRLTALSRLDAKVDGCSGIRASASTRIRMFPGRCRGARARQED
jgi:hypothetical protein